MKIINIISVSDGNKKDLKKTIDSVKNQNFKKYKHFIIAKKLEKKFLKKNKSNKIKFIVGKDSSIYNAMNIGEKLTYNNFTIYLNSGDVFFSNNSLRIVNNKIKNNLNGQFVTVLKYKNILFFPKKKFFFNKNTFTHSSFVRSPVKKNDIVFYDEDYLITADGNWMKENIKKNGLKRIYLPISIFSLDGVSTFPSLKTIIMKKNLDIKGLTKEVIKFIISKFTSRSFFYKLIYSTKYNYKYEKIYRKPSSN